MTEERGREKCEGLRIRKSKNTRGESKAQVLCRAGGRAMAPIGSVLRVESPSGTVRAALSGEHLDLEGIFKRTQKMGGGSP